ncbi:MAG: hypothetical protein H0T42_08350 [Deltaproteobacteria bacterium]|nr:hypothetical protein [Deltaproteobacteria bacterium]
MRTHAVVIALALAGCGGKKDEEAPLPPAPATPPVGSQGLPASSGVQLFVDDAAVATVNIAAVKDWPRLDSLLPEGARRLGKWQAIATKGAKTSELAKPFETYRDYVPALFPGEGGTINFGLFDPVELGKRGKPAVREDAITELRVKLDASGMRGGNDHGGGEVIDPAKVELVVKTAAGEKKLTGELLLGLPREPMPGGGGDAKGWRLDTILTAAGVTSYEKIMLYDAGGTTLPIEKKDVDASTIPFIKLNRQGSLRFRLYKKQGDGFQDAGDLRSLTRIDVLK